MCRAHARNSPAAQVRSELLRPTAALTPAVYLAHTRQVPPEYGSVLEASHSLPGHLATGVSADIKLTFTPKVQGAAEGLAASMAASIWGAGRERGLAGSLALPSPLECPGLHPPVFCTQVQRSLPHCHAASRPTRTSTHMWACWRRLGHLRSPSGEFAVRAGRGQMSGGAKPNV